MLKYFRTLKETAASNEEGFTLIELMIVVVIIGVLAAIAVPVFANQQKEAIKASGKADLRNTATAVATYQTKHAGQIPTSCSQMVEMLNTVTVSPGIEIRYHYSRLTPGSYYIRTIPTDPAFLNAAGTEVDNEYRMFYLSEHSKIFTSKGDLSRYMQSQGTNINTWLDDNNWGGAWKTVEGIGGCPTS